jgi:hypothetical protein
MAEKEDVYGSYRQKCSIRKWDTNEVVDILTRRLPESIISVLSHDHPEYVRGKGKISEIIRINSRGLYNRKMDTFYYVHAMRFNRSSIEDPSCCEADRFILTEDLSHEYISCDLPFALREMNINDELLGISKVLEDEGYPIELTSSYYCHGG